MYITSVPVTGQDFYGREELLELLLDFDPREIYFLNGIRCIGKSSILKEIDRQTQMSSQFTSVYFDLRRGITSEYLGKKLGEQIWQNIQNNAGSSKPEWLEKSLTKVIFEWVEYCSREEKKSYLLLDYADRLHELNKEELEELIVAIKNRGKFVQFIIAGTRRFFNLEKHSEEIQSKLLDLTDSVKPKIIGMVTEEIAKKIARKEKQEKPVEVTDTHFENIYQQCGGHPYILQKFCNSYFDKNSYSILDKPNEAFSHKSLNIHFGNNFDLLDDRQKQLLKQLLLPTAIKNTRLGDDRHYKELCDLGFLIETNSGEYSFSSELFATWMREHRIPKRIYIVCADKDEKKFIILKNQLSPQNIEIKWANDLDLGKNQITNIDTELSVADICIFILSHNTWANKRVMDIEMEFTKKHKHKLHYIIPLHIAPGVETSYNETGYIFVGNQKLPRVKEYVKTEKDWADVAKEIIELVKKI